MTVKVAQNGIVACSIYLRYKHRTNYVVVITTASEHTCHVHVYTCFFRNIYLLICLWLLKEWYFILFAEQLELQLHVIHRRGRDETGLKASLEQKCGEEGKRYLMQDMIRKFHNRTAFLVSFARQSGSNNQSSIPLHAVSIQHKSTYHSTLLWCINLKLSTSYLEVQVPSTSSHAMPTDGALTLTFARPTWSNRPSVKRKGRAGAQNHMSPYSSLTHSRGEAERPNLPDECNCAGRRRSLP